MVKSNLLRRHCNHGAFLMQYALATLPLTFSAASSQALSVFIGTRSMPPYKLTMMRKTVIARTIRYCRFPLQAPGCTSHVRYVPI